MGVQEDDFVEEGHQGDLVGEGFVEELTVDVDEWIGFVELR
jgi:hypothetical protein